MSNPKSGLSAEANAAAQLSPVQIVWRGSAMGVAEVVPGVSGGTIALITGIYPLLIESLARYGLSSLGQLRDLRAFAATHQLRFLSLLGLGMVIGVALFGRLMHYLMANYQPLVWAFFTGVILMSVWFIGRQRVRNTLMLWLPIGLVLGISLAGLPVQTNSGSLWYVFMGGMIAVCAWILPAVSGSYILAVLGLYPLVLAAINNFELDLLLVLGAGCATGLLLFVRVVAWLLQRFYEALLSLLCGFMAGSLLNIWPWQLAVGESKRATLVTPAEYELLSGGSASLMGCIISMVLGMLVLWLMSSFSSTKATSP